MVRGLLLLLTVTAGCSRADAAPKATTVELTAVTLADDCGGAPPWSLPPAPEVKTAAKSEKTTTTKTDGAIADIDVDSPGARAKAKRRCEQTSMQLAITAVKDTTIAVKSVELFDAKGKSLGKLTASKPTHWSADASMYEAWDQRAPKDTLENVSYVLSQPAWDKIGDRWNKTYTLKAVITIGGVAKTTKKSVTLTAPAALPPNVKT